MKTNIYNGSFTISSSIHLFMNSNLRIEFRTLLIMRKPRWSKSWLRKDLHVNGRPSREHFTSLRATSRRFFSGRYDQRFFRTFATTFATYPQKYFPTVFKCISKITLINIYGIVINYAKSHQHLTTLRTIVLNFENFSGQIYEISLKFAKTSATILKIRTTLECRTYFSCMAIA